MTNEQINAAIAKARGWRKEDGVYVWHGNGIDRTCWELWDWCNDLNAMHDAEATLTDANMFVMAHHIERLVAARGQHYFHATARQRAEAFLRTINKWEEAE